MAQNLSVSMFHILQVHFKCQVQILVSDFQVDEDPPLGLGTSVVVCFGRAVDQCGWRVVRLPVKQSMKFCSAGRHDGAAGAGRRGDHIVSPPTHSPAVELCSGGMGGNPWGESHIFPHTMDTLWTQTQILGKGSGPWPPTKLFSFFFDRFVWSFDIYQIVHLCP